jgi:hypothetical protein
MIVEHRIASTPILCHCEAIIAEAISSPKLLNLRRDPSPPAHFLSSKGTDWVAVTLSLRTGTTASGGLSHVESIASIEILDFEPNKLPLPFVYKVCKGTCFHHDPSAVAEKYLCPCQQVVKHGSFAPILME